MALKSRAQSSAERAIGPPWSSDEAKAIMPKRDTRPYVGLMPVMPQKAAGWRIEPPVSVPVAAGVRPAATAAAEPPDEPPGTAVLSHGFCTAPKAEFSLPEPMANSSQLTLPRVTMPAAWNFSTTVASNGLA